MTSAVLPEAEHAPEDARAAVDAARRSLESGDPAGALARADEALGRAPGFFQALRVRQDALLALDRGAEAWTEARSRADAKDDAASHVLLARLLADEATPVALERLDQALAVDPSFHWAHYGKGVLLAREGQFELAEMRFTDALGCWPDFVEARRARAEVRELFADYERAAEDYLAVLRLQPLDRAARYNLASILHRELARPAEAEEHYRFLLDLDPASPEALIGLAVCLSERAGAGPQEYRVAEGLLETARAGDPAALFDLGLLLETRLDRPADALRCFEEFLAYAGPGADSRSLADRLLFAPLHVEALRRRLAESASAGDSP